MSTKQFVNVQIDNNGIAIATIKKEPVNSMNFELWSELYNTLKECEANKSVRALVFASGLEKAVFTAGNDINELCTSRTTKEKYALFWRCQSEFLANLYQSRLVTAAAIRGQCPAGGCVLAMVCDIRVISREGNPRMGLNEVALGIVPPKWWARVMIDRLGHARSEDLLFNARMVDTTEALAIGLVDQVVDTPELLPATLSRVNAALKFPAHARAQTKQYTRSELSKGWISEIDYEIEHGWKMLSTPQITKMLEMSLARLSKAKL